MFRTAVVISLLAAEVGVAVLPGVGVLLIALPLQVLVGVLTNRRQEARAEIADKRVAMMTGVIDAMKVVKYNVWEPFFEEQVERLRQEEMEQLKYITTLRSAGFLNSFATPVLVSLVCFATYYLAGLGTTVSAVTSFTVLSIANSLRYPLFMIPNSAKAVTGMSVLLSLC